MNGHVDDRWIWVRRGGVFSLAVIGIAVIGIAAVGLSVRGGSQPTEPVPADVDSVDGEADWDVDGEADGDVDGFPDESLLDLADLADVHATSRLQYDECQQDYAAISSRSSSSRHPQYFC